MDIKRATELFYLVLNTFFNECVPDRFPSKVNRPPWFTNAMCMYLSRCKFEYSNDPKQFYYFVNAKRKSSALPSSLRFNSMEASTDS